MVRFFIEKWDIEDLKVLFIIVKILIGDIIEVNFEIIWENGDIWSENNF